MKRIPVVLFSLLLLLPIGCTKKGNASEKILAQAQSINGGFGFIDETGSWAIDPEYEKASAFSEGLAAVKKNGLWGYIDKSGRFIIDPQYAYAMPFSDEMAPVYIQSGDIMEEWFIDKSGNKQFRLTLREGDWYDDFHEGLLKAYKGGKYGYFNKHGETVIPFQFDYATSFDHGLAVVGNKGNIASGWDDKYGVIDTNGKAIVSLKYTDVLLSDDRSLISAYMYNRESYLDRRSDIFSNNGLLLFTKEGYVSAFTNGYAEASLFVETTKQTPNSIMINSKYYVSVTSLIDNKGDFLLDPMEGSYRQRGEMVEKYETIPDQTKKNAYIDISSFLDLNGKTLFTLPGIRDKLNWIDGEDFMVMDLYDGFAIVYRFWRLKGQYTEGPIIEKRRYEYAVVNAKGEIMIPTVEMDSAYFYHNGTLVGYDADEKAYVFANGTSNVIKRKIENKLDYHFSLWAVCENGRWGFLDTSGKYAIEPQFLWAGAFHSVE